MSAENDRSRHSSVVFQLVKDGFGVWLDVQSCEAPLPSFDAAHSVLPRRVGPWWVPARRPASLPVVTSTRALGRVVRIPLTTSPEDP